MLTLVSLSLLVVLGLGTRDNARLCLLCLGDAVHLLDLNPRTRNLAILKMFLNAFLNAPTLRDADVVCLAAIALNLVDDRLVVRKLCSPRLVEANCLSCDDCNPFLWRSNMRQVTRRNPPK